MSHPEKWVRIRIRLIGFCFIAVFGLVAARAFYLQVLCRADYEKRAERQHQKVIPLPPQRGTIFDRSGAELALSVEVDSVFVEPAKLVDPDTAAQSLASALSLPYASLKAKLESKKSFIWLKRQISHRESVAVRALKLPGIGLTREHKRYYPNSEIGAQVVGFTGLDPRGLEGVELQYDSVILGQGGYLVTERDALGRELGSGDAVVEGGKGGSNLYLTLDKNLQYIAEKELAEGVRKANAKAGTVVVLEPRTGEILAMASQPTYNPNAVGRANANQWRNRAICDTYEPGSTFKPFLVAAALNEGLIRPDHKIHCENGAFKVGGRTIHDHHKYENLSITEILKVSSNIGVAKIGKMLERERYHRYIKDFGFGQPTGVHLPGEVVGQVRNPNKWFEIDLAAISFGQGITVTPLQLAAATAVIANGGYLMTPYVVDRVVDSYGQVIEKHEPTVVRQVVSEQVARQVREMMIAATEQGGTGTLGNVPGFKIAGKTGTAQKVDPVTGGYSVDKRIASFCGFVPAESPRLVILVVIDEPTGQTYGGLVAAPVFSRVAAQSLRYLNVSPTEPVQQVVLAPLPEIEPSVRPSSPSTQKAEPLPENAGPPMPDFTGMSYRQALKAMQETGINVRLEGTGRAVEQQPPPGRPVTFGSEVWVRFAAPT